MCVLLTPPFALPPPPPQPTTATAAIAANFAEPASCGLLGWGGEKLAVAIIIIMIGRARKIIHYSYK